MVHVCLCFRQVPETQWCADPEIKGRLQDFSYSVLAAPWGGNGDSSKYKNASCWLELSVKGKLIVVKAIVFLISATERACVRPQCILFLWQGGATKVLVDTHTQV